MKKRNSNGKKQHGIFYSYHGSGVQVNCLSGRSCVWVLVATDLKPSCKIRTVSIKHLAKRDVYKIACQMAQSIWKANQPSCGPSVKANCANFFLGVFIWVKRPWQRQQNENIQMNKQVVKSTYWNSLHKWSSLV